MLSADTMPDDIEMIVAGLLNAHEEFCRQYGKAYNPRIQCRKELQCAIVALVQKTREANKPKTKSRR